MSRNIFFYIKCFLITFLSFFTASLLAVPNEHPAFKLKSKEQLAEINPKSSNQTVLSRSQKAPSMDNLHFEEKHPDESSILVDTASIDISKLIQSRVMSLDPEQPEVILPDPQITIDGNDYILSIVESFLDVKQDVRYVTAKIVGHQGISRFIVDDTSGEVVGNLSIDGQEYRVIPREIDYEQQLIYRIRDVQPDKYTGRSKRKTVSKPSHISANRLEKQLLKTQLLYEIEPALYRQTLRVEGTSTNLIKGNIGRIGVSKTLKKDPSEILKLLVNLDSITLARDDLEYRVTQVRGNKNDGYSARFRQVINGIPLRAGSMIKFDSQGNVTQLSAQVVDPLLADIRRSKLLKSEVIEIAKRSVEKHLNEPDLQFIMIDRVPIKLSYKTIDNNFTLTPYWEVVIFEVQSGAGSYRVFVDGHTGEVQVTKAADHVTTQFQTDVCEHESGISLDLCEDVNITIPTYPPITVFSTVKDVIEESSTGQFICKLLGLCQDPQAKNPWEVINNMEDWLSENTGGVCCNEVGGLSDSVDVKINTQGSGGPSYNHGTGTLSFPHPSSLDPAVWNPVQTQKFDDIVVHEASHAVLRGVNEDLSAAINDGDPWATAMNEGFSDAMAVLYSEKFDPPGDTKVGEGAFKNASDIRDISESKTFDDFVDSTAAGMAHQNGKIFGNFIYRARQAGLTVD